VLDLDDISYALGTPKSCHNKQIKWRIAFWRFVATYLLPCFIYTDLLSI